MSIELFERVEAFVVCTNESLWSMSLFDRNCISNAECLYPQNFQSTQYLVFFLCPLKIEKISHPIDYGNACAKCMDEFNDEWHCTEYMNRIYVHIFKIIPNKRVGTLQMAFIGNIENILSKKWLAAKRFTLLCFACKSFGAFFFFLPSVCNYISHTRKSCARKASFFCLNAKKSRISI